MTIYQLVIVLLLLVIIGFEVLMYLKIKKHINSGNSFNTVPQEEFFTDYERELLERNASFDRRIAAIKDELAFKTADKRRMYTSLEDDGGVSAEELHPNVKNIPHNVIRINGYNSLPDVEYME